MKFRFKFAPVEKHRKILVDLARKEYLDAQAKVDDKLAEIKGYYTSIDNARDRAVSAQVEGGKRAAELVQIEEFIKGQEVRIERARREARELMSVAEEKHEILIERVRDHKAMLKLRERHFEEFRRTRKKLAQKEVDDQMVMRKRLL